MIDEQADATHGNHVREWLVANDKTPQDVRWGKYPIGMVGRWIERAESAERERDSLREERDAHPTKAELWHLVNDANARICELEEGLAKIYDWNKNGETDERIMTEADWLLSQKFATDERAARAKVAEEFVERYCTWLRL